MMNLNDREWNSFKLASIFDYYRGKRLIADNRRNGKLAYYSASDTNNGVTDFISNPLFIEKENAIVCTTFGQAYYAMPNFTTSDEITILKNKNINKYTGLFISMCIEKNRSKYAFGRKAFSNKLMNDKIMLPVDKDGNPDYEFMEEYMKEKESKTISKYKDFIETRIPLGGVTTNVVVNWKSIKIRNLFNIYTGGDLILSRIKNGNIPIVSHSNINNGIAAWTEEINGRKLFNHNKTLSLADRGNFSAKYQLLDFYIGTRVKALEYKEEASKELLMFIANQINIQAAKFSYGHNACDNIGIVKIMLPVKKDGNLDIEYIENYMKLIEYTKIKKYLNYLNNYNINVL